MKVNFSVDVIHDEFHSVVFGSFEDIQRSTCNASSWKCRIFFVFIRWYIFEKYVVEYGKITCQNIHCEMIEMMNVYNIVIYAIWFKYDFLMIPITFIFVFRWWRHEHDQRTSWVYHKKGWWSSNSCFDRKKSFERDLFLPSWRDTMIINDDHFKSQEWHTEMSWNIHIMIFWWISKEWHFSWFCMLYGWIHTQDFRITEICDLICKNPFDDQIQYRWIQYRQSDELFTSIKIIQRLDKCSLVISI